MDPGRRKNDAEDQVLGQMLFAASLGDVAALTAQKNAGLDFSMAGINFSNGDYDYRTALHLAASEGHLDCVNFIIDSTPPERRDDVL